MVAYKKELGSLQKKKELGMHSTKRLQQRKEKKKREAEKSNSEDLNFMILLELPICQRCANEGVCPKRR